MVGIIRDKSYYDNNIIKNPESIDENKVGTIESVLSGIASGIIKIPEGAISLGANLIDLGTDNNTAAKVENFFDDINPFEEKAEATTAGKITETLINLGIPGGIAFTKGANLANKAIKAKKAKQYFNTNNKPMSDAARKAIKLNAKENTTKYAVGALGSGIAEGIFIGDVNSVGTFGDLLGGPTEITRSDEKDYDPGREIINRIKFGTEGAIFSGVLGGVGATIKKLSKRGQNLSRSDSALDRVIDKIGGAFRSRSNKDIEFFDEENIIKGLKASDVNLAQEVSRDITKDIDSIFPNLKSMYDQSTIDAKKKVMKEINDLLLSGKPIEGPRSLTFPKLNKESDLYKKVLRSLKKQGLKKEESLNIINGLDKIRGRWGEMFTSLTSRMDPKDLNAFMFAFGKKFTTYLDDTYEIFENKSLLPFLNYRPSKELLKETEEVFMKLGNITKEQAQFAVSQIIKTAKYPKGVAIGEGKSARINFKLPEELLNKSILDNTDNISGRGRVSLDMLKRGTKNSPGAQDQIEKLFKKIENPISTILGGTEKLSLIVRQMEFHQRILDASKNAVSKAKGTSTERNAGMIFKDPKKAASVFGDDNVTEIRFDAIPEVAGIKNPLQGQFTSKAMANALMKSDEFIKSDTALGYALNNFILLPKATSQMAKTILSPFTHARNFISAGAFAAANGIIPNKEAITTAYQALQIPVKGARKSLGRDAAGNLQGNELYRRLLELGVVNSNVRLGDLKQLLGDMTFLDDALSANSILRKLTTKLGRAKKVTQDFYTAEDDFWKITAWAVEKSRLEKAYKKFAVNKSSLEIEKEAAEIVRNLIPNYDYVSDFVKALRKFPVGNFVSFPAEIMRTGTNIVRRALKEINYRDPETNAKVLQRIGMQRLIGFGVTTTAVPVAVVEGARAIYNVSKDEIDALRRYVPKWSKNSTIVPIRDEKTGKLKYVDFSRTNAYDTLTRPIQTVINAVQEGREDEDGIMDDFLIGMFEATKEIGSPFISESIWTEASLDILARGGRTRDGKVLYNDQTPIGDKVSTIIAHLVKTQTPGSIESFKRMGLSIKGDVDKYGRGYEFLDEFAGIAGFRVIQVDAEKGIDFKIADFQRGIRNSRSLFTSNLLKGGPVDPADIVDQYLKSNQAAYNVKKEMMKDYYAGLRLGGREDVLNKAFKTRGANKELRAIQNGEFTPFKVSDNVRKAFRENAEAIGEADPYEQVRDYINEIFGFYRGLPLSMETLPFIPNPFREVQLSPNDTTYLPSSNVDDIVTTAGSTISVANKDGLGKTKSYEIDNQDNIVSRKTI